MHRSATIFLQNWQQQSDQMPLLVKGARQVGKTFLIESFGSTSFQQVVTINFELMPEYKACFETLDPKQIMSRIALLSKKNIIPQKTLLFLDEIQECPEAIQALRYFKELLPSQHVIAAGSLLEFVLNAPGFRMPVGRIQSLYLKPLSFYEYLDAIGNQVWKEHLRQIRVGDQMDQVLHQKLLACLKDYLILGGMPAVLQSFINQNDYQRCQEIQASIMDTYRSDFGKYAKKTEYSHLQLLFSKLPGLVGKTIKYAHISPDIRSKDLKRALQLLTSANLVLPIRCSQASGLPFNTYQSETKFKLLFLDVGLMQHTTQLSADILLASDLMLLHKGALTEQFVGQELTTILPCYQQNELFYWEREKASSQAEVDYVIHVGSHILPVEVKAGKTGRLKSLQVFMEEKASLLGIRVSQLPIAYERNILSVPLYMIPEIPRLVKEITSE